jgi:uncharacterized protein (DUF2336 family)
MVAYHQFLELSQSENSEARGQAAHLAAMAYLAHRGPADEHAALYAALISFLDDPSVKVRAALAYGLLHAPEAPRPILLALLQDSAVISRAVVQYSPALIDADLIGLIRTADLSMLLAICLRETLGLRVVEALLARADRAVTLRLLARADAQIAEARLNGLAETLGSSDAQVRGALLARHDLPARARLTLIESVAKALRGARIVAGAIEPQRLDRVLRNATDMAMTDIGEREAARPQARYAAEMIEQDRVSTRVMLHAICNGHVLFFADCVAELSGIGRAKVFTLLESGSRAALNALLARCGLSPSVRNLIARLVFHARAADLADDIAARHFVVTALTEELIVEHDGQIPAELEEAFSYLCEQNVGLARTAARGVMAAFAAEPAGARDLPTITADQPLALPAA